MRHNHPHANAPLEPTNAQTGTTALYIAAWRGFEGMVELLLQSGANVNVARKKVSSLLFDFALLFNFARVYFLTKLSALLHMLDYTAA